MARPCGAPSSGSALVEAEHPPLVRRISPTETLPTLPQLPPREHTARSLAHDPRPFKVQSLAIRLVSKDDAPGPTRPRPKNRNIQFQNREKKQAFFFSKTPSLHLAPPPGPSANSSLEIVRNKPRSKIQVGVFKSTLFHADSCG